MKRLLFAISFILLLSYVLSAQTVYITKTGSKYHSGDCSNLRKSSIPISLKDAIDRGYSACSRCKPPIMISKDKDTLQSITPVVKKAKIEKQTIKVNSSERCQAVTKKGTQCKRKAQPGSNYCWQHNR